MIKGQIEAGDLRDDRDLKVLTAHVKESARQAHVWATSLDLRPSRKETAQAVAANLAAAAQMLEQAR